MLKFKNDKTGGTRQNYTLNKLASFLIALSVDHTCMVCIFSCLLSPTIAGTHWTYPQRDGQTELTWMSRLHTKMLPVPLLTGTTHCGSSRPS